MVAENGNGAVPAVTEKAHQHWGFATDSNLRPHDVPSWSLEFDCARLAADLCAASWRPPLLSRSAPTTAAEAAA